MTISIHRITNTEGASGHFIGLACSTGHMENTADLARMLGRQAVKVTLSQN